MPPSEQATPVGQQLARALQNPGEVGEPEWLEPTRQALLLAPDSPRAQRLAVHLVESMPGASLAFAGASAQRVADAFFVFCGVAPFLANFLIRHPTWFALLVAEDDATMPALESLAARLDESLAQAERSQPSALAVVLREFKYYELARITLRDASPRGLPLERSDETLVELSRLADLLLDRALRIAQAEVADACGAPRWRWSKTGESRELAFCALGLGKLGSQELNYSSDVDLVYVYEAPPEALAHDPEGNDSEGSESTPAEYFTRVAQALGKLVSESSPDGFLYRIDLELRPEGLQGNLVISDAALATYYEVQADTWEKAAFMKARVVAGDSDFGHRTLLSLDPMIYRSSTDYGGVQSIREWKSKVEDAHGGGDAGFNVKLDSGGIRDIEFIAQAMQLLHGGRIAQIRARSTQSALERLAGVEILPRDEVEALLESYRFLRRLENRLQMEAERQTHVVPTDAEARARLARAMSPTGDGTAEGFAASLERHRKRVLEFFDAFFADEGVGQIFEFFARNAPSLVSMEPSRSMIRRLSEHFAREIGASPNSELALNNLDRFVHAVGRRRFYYDLLLDRPELVPRLTAMFAASRFLSNILASHPRLIEPVFSDPAILIPTRAAMRDELAALVRGSETSPADPIERNLQALRLFVHRQVLNAGLLDIAGEIERAEAEAALSQIAEVCVEAALGLARDLLAARVDGVPDAARDGTFLIVAMGKLATRELSYGSDLDLIFLFDTAGADEVGGEAQEYFVRLAQRFIWSLQTSTADGRCYEIDARLRPSGNQGLLVTSLASFRRYHEGRAQGWERQALLRARPIVGEDSLADAFSASRREILVREPPADLATELHRIRTRMEEELAHEGRAHRNFKTGHGGVLDVESVAQYLQLLHGRKSEELLEPSRLEASLDQLHRLGHLNDAAHHTLRDGWAFLQQLGNRLRIVENRSISDLDEERGDLEGLARRMGYGSPGRERGARRELFRDYDRHTEAIRAVYRKILGV